MVRSRATLILAFVGGAVLACQRSPGEQRVRATAQTDGEDTLARRVDDVVRAHMAKRGIPGLAIAVVRDGATLFIKGYGIADVENDVPVTPETVFDIASVTKTFTAAAIMRLADSGRVNIDRPVREYLPEAPESWSRITVRHLLSHTSGLPETDVPLVNGAWLADYTTRQMLEHAFTRPVAAGPGASFLYSDLGYFLLGAIIERVTGMRYGEFLDRTFFAPFEMRATSPLDQYAIVPRKADTYFLRERQLARNRRYAQVELSPAYGLLTSILDFARWESAFALGRVISPSAMRSMETKARTPDGSELQYGLGWVVGSLNGERATGHAGGTGTYYLRLPDRRLSIIVLTNLALRTLDGGRVRPDGSNPRELAETIAGMYLAQPTLPARIPDPYARERGQMVERQLRGRGIRDRTVLAAMARVPRHRFVPAELQSLAYSDQPLPIGLEQTISQPYIVAYMTEAADISPGDRVLEIGTGSGYQAAVLAELAREVYSIEIIPELAARARAVLAELGYRNVHVRTGDGYAGWPEHAPFDAILVTAAPDHAPPALVQQLAVGARMVIPVGTGEQEMRIITKTATGFVEQKTLPVRFVPLVRPDSVMPQPH